MTTDREGLLRRNRRLGRPHHQRTCGPATLTSSPNQQYRWQRRHHFGPSALRRRRVRQGGERCAPLPKRCRYPCLRRSRMRCGAHSTWSVERVPSGRMRSGHGAVAVLHARLGALAVGFQRWGRAGPTGSMSCRPRCEFPGRPSGAEAARAATTGSSGADSHSRARAGQLPDAHAYVLRTWHAGACRATCQGADLDGGCGPTGGRPALSDHGATDQGVEVRSARRIIHSSSSQQSALIHGRVGGT